MTLPLAPQEVYIRLEDAEMALVCTIRFGELRTSVSKFPVGPLSCIGPEENEPDLVRVRNRFRSPDALR